MNFPGRELASLALLGSVLPIAVQAASATQTYPQHPVTLVVGFPAGGGVDTLARLLAKHMTEDLGQKVVVENRPGAASSIAAESVARAAPDGHELYLSTHPSPAHRPGQDAGTQAAPNRNGPPALVPVGLLATISNVVVTGPHSSIDTIAELVARAQAQPQTLSLGSPGIGSPPHLLGQLFMRKSNSELLHVPYRGGAPAVPDAIAGRVDVLFISLPGALEHIKAGALRPLAVMSRLRVPLIGHVPTMEESGMHGIDMDTRLGLMAPAGTPLQVIERLNESINAVLLNPALQKALIARGYMIPSGANTPAEFDRLVADEAGKWEAASAPEPPRTGARTPRPGA